MPTADVFDPGYWRERVSRAAAIGEPHRAIFNGTRDAMAEAEGRQWEALDGLLSPDETVLDLGCGYGRLLDYFQRTFKRVPPADRYLGVDVSPDLVEMARVRWSSHWFQVGDLRTFQPDRLPKPGGDLKYDLFDVGVLLWVRQPVVAHAGSAEWERIERNCRRFCRQLVVVD